MNGHTRLSGLLLVFGLAPVACFDNVTTPFVGEDLEPIAENVATFPGDGTSTPEDRNIVFQTNGKFIEAHLKGYVHAPLEDVFATMSTPEVTVHYRAVDEWSIEMIPESPFLVNYVVDNFVDAGIISVDYDLEWRHDVVEGTVDEPLLTAARCQKTWGSEVIRVLEGSFLARPNANDPNVTEVEMIYRGDFLREEEGDVTDFVRDYYFTIVEHVNGRGIPYQN